MCICCLCSNSWTKEPAAHFVLYAISLSWYIMVPEIWTMLLRGWLCLHKCSYWNLCILELSKVRVAFFFLFPYKVIKILLTLFPMLHITSPWLIYFITGSLYLLVPFPYFAHPPSPCPLASVCSLYLCVSFCFMFVRLYIYVNGTEYIYIPHISEIIQYLSFSVWLISLSIIPSMSIHVVTNGNILFFFKPE